MLLKGRQLLRCKHKLEIKSANRKSERAQEGYIGEGRFVRGSAALSPSPMSPLWVLSWRHKKVPPPAGITRRRVAADNPCKVRLLSFLHRLGDGTAFQLCVISSDRIAGVERSSHLRNARSSCFASILTYCTNRTLPYHLYADESGLFVSAAPLTSGSLSKKQFFDRLKRLNPDVVKPFCVNILFRMPDPWNRRNRF